MRPARRHPPGTVPRRNAERLADATRGHCQDEAVTGRSVADQTLRTPPAALRDWSPKMRPSPRRTLYAMAFVAVLLACLALSGQLPGLTGSNVTTVGQDGAVQCLANHGLSRLPLSCPEVGLPTGERLMQGLPVFLVGWAFAVLPGVSAHNADVLTDILIVLLALLGARSLLRRFGAGEWVSLGAAGAWVVTPSLLALVPFGGTYWGLLLLPAILTADAFLIEKWRGTPGRGGILVLAVWTLLRLAILLLDGYTFVISIVAAALLAPAAFRRLRRVSALGAVLAYAGSAGLAYVLYQLYVPGGDFAQSSIDLVRSMGLDVITLVQPAHLQWWSHLTGHQLNGSTLWGDGSNSAGNYLGFVCLGLAIFGAVRFRKSRRRLVAGLIACFLVGLVMSFGAVTQGRRPTAGADRRDLLLHIPHVLPRGDSDAANQRSARQGAGYRRDAGGIPLAGSRAVGFDSSRGPGRPGNGRRAATTRRRPCPTVGPCCRRAARGRRTLAQSGQPHFVLPLDRSRTTGDLPSGRGTPAGAAGEVSRALCQSTAECWGLPRVALRTRSQPSLLQRRRRQGAGDQQRPMAARRQATARRPGLGPARRTSAAAQGGGCRRYPKILDALEHFSVGHPPRRIKCRVIDSPARWQQIQL